MNAPRWWAQRFPPEGGTASDGIRRLLGTPGLDPLTVLVREMAQNSWDARALDQSSICFSIAIDTLKGDRLAAWRHWLKSDSENADFGLDLLLSAPQVQLLTISDRGTTGLGGPIRGGLVSDESPDFVNFVRNVGERRDREFGGGTYGFGKGSLYQISRCNTVMVSTVCRFNGEIQRRLIGTALGHSFSTNGLKFTGRHWWGQVNDGVPDPLLDRDALDAANALGLPNFDDNSTGTDLVVVAARFGSISEELERAAADAAKYMASALTWYLWPKLIDRGAGTPMQCRVSVDGEPVDLPDPERDPRIAPFVAALRKLDNGQGKQLERRRVPRISGEFAVEMALSPQRPTPLTDLAEPFSGPAHHCARMRHVELIVDYLEGPELPDSIAQYGGVFRAHKDADDYFAESEPPTHDAWVVRHLSGTAMGVVRDATSYVKTQMQELMPKSVTEPPWAAEVPLGGLSQRLARAIPGGPGNAASGAASRGGGASGSSRKFRIVSAPALVLIDGLPRVVAEVQFDPSRHRVSVTATASVATDSGREASPPMGAPSPTVIGWVAEDGARVDRARLDVDAGSARRWTVVVAPADDTATQLDISAAEPEGGSQ